eukprot:3681953-Rhodomonas_salina.1
MSEHRMTRESEESGAHLYDADAPFQGLGLSPQHLSSHFPNFSVPDEKLRARTYSGARNRVDRCKIALPR